MSIGMGVEQKQKCLEFYISTTTTYVKAKILNEIDEDSLTLVKNICGEFAKVSINSYQNKGKKRELSKLNMIQQYKYAVQAGICHWINDKNEKMEELFLILKEWSRKTYEGRSAAAKKLSLEGLAIKISTDGYVEVFIKGNRIFEIK